MPNLCANRMKVSGPAQFVDQFVSDCLSGANGLDFDKIIPMPAVLDGASVGTSDSMGSDAEIGIEVLTRKPWRSPYRKEESVLDREQAREAGIKNHDDLEAWVRRERPQALETGRKCLRAFEETGYWFARDWRVDKWGTNWIEQFELVDRTETTIEATFATPWSTADKVFHEMARRHPNVEILVAAVEEGNEFSYLFTAGSGLVREEHPGLTREFMEEVLGAPLEVDDLYLRPATLRQRPLTHFRHWRDERQLQRSLAGYPAYEPPHHGIEMLMPESEARENFEYFMSGREARVGYLRSFLASFGVALAFSDSAKTALDGWVSRYGAFLYVAERGSSFLTRNPAWRGPRAGLNAIFDLALFLGEFAIRESENLRWEMQTDVPEGLRGTHESYQRPCIAGIPGNPRYRFYIMDDVYRICHGLQEASYLWRKPRFQVLPKTLYAQFASRTLRNMYLMARGDVAGANDALR
jgi:hypothetical protein